MENSILDVTHPNDFLKVSSLKSLKHLSHTNKGFVRFIWISVNITFIATAISTAIFLWESHTTNPTLTTLENSNYPIYKIPFPGVSICSLNKISKRKAESIATLISETTYISLDKIKNYMKILGDFYDFGENYDYNYLEFQGILDSMPNSNEFKPTSLLKQLTPSCEEFLIWCSWQSTEVNCSDIFQMRLTFEGYCCIFNYVKNTTEKIDSKFLSKEIIYGEAGLEQGLSVEINNNLDDYYYTAQDSSGAQIHIFNPTDYPDKNSGGLSEEIIGFGREVLVQLEATSLHSVKDVTYHPINKRECYFPFEKTTSFGPYSEYDCLIDCRIESMASLCSCVPFTIPQNRSPVCNLSELQCLKKYKLKWQSISPPIADVNDNLLKEFYVALLCPQRCYPLCDSFVYQVYTNLSPLKNPAYGNNSLIHIFYRSRDSVLYKQDVLFHWFEIIGRVGGIFSVFLGISIISIIEIFTFFFHKLQKLAFLEILFDEDYCLWRF